STFGSVSVFDRAAGNAIGQMTKAACSKRAMRMESSAHFAAQSVVQRAEAVDHRGDRARARLKQVGAVQRYPTEAELGDFGGASGHAIGIGKESLPLTVVVFTRRGRQHGLKLNRFRIAAEAFHVLANRLHFLCDA